MADVTVFTQRFCGCCADAKRLLRKKGVAFREVPTKESGGRAGLRSRFGPGAGTFPQIVINGRHIGGASDLAALEASGELDRLLAGTTDEPSEDVDRPARPVERYNPVTLGRGSRGDEATDGT
jgi:glutaredoxin 3